MTIGEYCGVPLQDACDTWRNGAVFLLRNRASASCSVSLDGWITTVVSGKNIVVTCGPSTATDYEATFIEALNAANRGLDYLSVTRQADCVISDALDESLVWWPDTALGGVVMRCRVVQLFGIRMTVTLEVRDAHGNIKPAPPPPTPMADDAFRFIRMARTTEDLFDAYRNLFLAFESLLSDLRPRLRVSTEQQRRRRWRCLTKPQSIGGTRWETENKWFMDALDHADKLVPLATLTPPEVTNHKKWIYRRVYSDERSGLMHAKRGQNYLLPHDTSDRAELIESLGRLWDYIKNLIETHLHVQGRSGSLTRDGFDLMAQNALPQFPLVVSDDDGPLNREAAANLFSPDATVVQLRSLTPRVDPDDPELWTMLARCETSDLVGLTPIRRFGHMRPDGICEVVSGHIGPLTLGGTVVRLEIERGLRYVNPTGPPRQFSS